MKIKIYQVDAFAENPFTGNPAAVCPLQTWLADELMQKIAMENNLAETAFYVRTGKEYHIRWFTPAVEVNLCGHATLATAWVLYHCEGHASDVIEFYSHRSGNLRVSKKGADLTLDFPVDEIHSVEMRPELSAGFNISPLEVYRGKTDLMFVFRSETEIKNLDPDFVEIAKLPVRGVIVTAPGNDCDFVSRFFAPQSGINEDPVTGSAHTTLTPYWSKRLGKKHLTATQISPRKGWLQCEDKGDRILISGKACLYLQGEIMV